jgi:septum formation protein
MIPLLLASASPRRSELLGKLGVGFRVVPSPIDEASLQLSGTPQEQVQASAEAKGLAVAQDNPGCWVLSADTIVCIDEQILGKPRDSEDAKRMLSLLQGQRHRVLTGVCLSQILTEGSKSKLIKKTSCTETAVWMADMDPTRIAAYVATGEPMDKAGAYAIQGYGSCLIREISGCYSNVVGLPLYQTALLLEEAGIKIWQVCDAEHTI